LKRAGGPALIELGKNAEVFYYTATKKPVNILGLNISDTEKTTQSNNYFEDSV
jgi:hypothetical protein